jgi:hypothetical protein
MIGLARAPRIAAIVAAIGADRRRPQTACRDALGDDNAPGLDLLVHPIQSFTALLKTQWVMRLSGHAR